MLTPFILAVLFASISFAEIYSIPSYDYVIVGRGTAGLALANRLSSNFSVAVIEAGGYYHVIENGTAQVPGLDILVAGMSPEDVIDTDWKFISLKQEPMGVNFIMLVESALVAGASIDKTGMIGTSESYEQWADSVGDESYAFDEFLPTPNASARYNESAYDSEGGPVQITYPDYASPFSNWLGGSMAEVGIPLTDDFHSGVLDGAKFCEVTINPKTKLRDSSQTSTGHDLACRGNLWNGKTGRPDGGGG
ncbi:hypothetical protein EPUS_00402 [Endocarpon pusillum Z07020]|uniref:Uncharacterized protein n=1 Tax=Endocarpon pusillum (strain Z07020 / HMAS-L-300199) TaxID=1263415 RepID=U1HMI0_ENDPU|nr:uncharacterized protein EPUS_00402 [Endocarpon pusillum Z07020]ERF70214.1 hypothetical protein EPUS_00402 [Endocarpon pusillum Z07020]